MPIFSYDDLMEMPSRYRGNLLNKVSGIKPANLIATISKERKSNLAIFNSVVHIGANPPYLGFVLRPTTVERHTYENIKETGSYTINQITTEFYEKAHQTSAKYERGVSEFERVGLTEEYYANSKVPFVKESIIKIALEFEEEHFITCNDTRLIVGKITQLMLPDNVIAQDGDINLEELDTVGIGGLDSYYKLLKMGNYPYAKP